MDKFFSGHLHVGRVSIKKMDLSSLYPGITHFKNEDKIAYDQAASKTQ